MTTSHDKSFRKLTCRKVSWGSPEAPRGHTGPSGVGESQENESRCAERSAASVWFIMVLNSSCDLHCRDLSRQKTKSLCCGSCSAYHSASIVWSRCRGERDKLLTKNKNSEYHLRVLAFQVRAEVQVLKMLFGVTRRDHCSPASSICLLQRAPGAH